MMGQESRPVRQAAVAPACASASAASPPEHATRHALGIAVAFGLAALTLLILLPHAADAQCAGGPPPNDCWAAAKVGSGSYSDTQSNVGATLEAGEPTPPVTGTVGATIWYKWTALYAGAAVASLCASAADFDSVMGVYTGSTLATMALITSNDDGCGPGGGPSLASFTCTAGTVYYIQVGGWAQTVGTGVLSVSGCSTPPPPGPPSCSPGTQNVGIGVSATLTASGGTGAYDWSGGGSPATGTGSPFSTSFSTVGSKTITLTSPGSGPPSSVTCTVNVSALTPTCAPGTLNVYTGQSFTLSAAQGTGTYSWSGGEEPSATGAGASFTTSFATDGTKIVKVTSTGSGPPDYAECTITVALAPPPPPPPPANRTDTDQDGVENDSDNCPALANNAQQDLDRDGEGDPCDADEDGDQIDGTVDNCARVVNADQADADGDGVGDLCENVGGSDGNASGNPSDGPDQDLDGIPDTSDNCPADANHDQLDVDGDHIGDICDTDLDGDGVSNDAIADDGVVLTFTDNCPQHSNPDQEDSDDNGVGDACQYEVGWIPSGIESGATAAAGQAEPAPDGSTTLKYALLTVGAAVLVAGLVGVAVALLRPKK